MSAYIESDSMAPQRLVEPVQIKHVDRTSLDIQLSINAALMKRLDALEKKVKELEYRQAV